MEKIHRLIFISTVVLTIFLRLFMLSQVPPGINRDEASIGYTAYALNQTGRDEYGGSFPISFQSFGDWKLPLYIYTTTLTVRLFGISEFAVRIPSVLFGIATVVLTFFLVKTLFNNNRLALLTMFLVSVAPWHIHLSRVESESNVAVFFTTAGVFLFLLSLKRAAWLIIPSLIFFALTYFTYAGNYIFTTLLLAGLVVIYGSEVPRKRPLLIALVLFSIFTGFIAFHTLGGNKTKFSGINIFGDPAAVHAKIELPRNEHENPQSLFTRIFHNRAVFAVERIGQNYLNGFSPQFLFIKGGDNKAHNIANFGNMYIIEAPFLLLGFIFLIAKKSGKEKKLILWWFLIAPIAASLTKDAPHTNRMFAIFPILPLVVAMGIEWTHVALSRYKIISAICVTLVSLLFAGNIGIYLDRYFVHFPRDEAENWGLAFKKLSELITSDQLKDKHVVMTKPESSPYIFLLFYQAYDPSRYQREAIRYAPTEDGFIHVRSFDQYEFREIDWTADLAKANTLVVARPTEIPDFVKSAPHPRHDVALPNGQVMFTVFETP